MKDLQLRTIPQQVSSKLINHETVIRNLFDTRLQQPPSTQMLSNHQSKLIKTCCRQNIFSRHGRPNNITNYIPRASRT
ncbi:unnamed protein product [Caenorhabditis brenneri]